MFDKYNSKKSRNASCEHILKISEEWVAAIPRVWSSWEVPRLPNGRLLLGAPSSSPGWPWLSPASWSWPRTARRSTSPGSYWCTASSQWSPGSGPCWPVLTGRYELQIKDGVKLESLSLKWCFLYFVGPNLLFTSRVRAAGKGSHCYNKYIQVTDNCSSNIWDPCCNVAHKTLTRVLLKWVLWMEPTLGGLLARSSGELFSFYHICSILTSVCSTLTSLCFPSMYPICFPSTPP